VSRRPIAASCVTIGTVSSSGSQSTTRSFGLILALAYAALIGWLYLRQPQTLAQVSGGLASVVGAYRIDDPAVRDSRTQFYIAYSYYRQGWGRLYHDDALYHEGLDAVDRAMTLAAGGQLLVDDPMLEMHNADELKAELLAGVRRDASDFNPMRLLSHRK
jgi:hypothetical protein